MAESTAPAPTVPLQDGEVASTRATADNSGPFEVHGSQSESEEPVESSGKSLQVPVHAIALLGLSAFVDPGTGSVQIVGRVRDILPLKLPRIAEQNSHPKHAGDQFSELPPDDIFSTYLSDIPIPSIAFIRSLLADFGQKWRTGSRSIKWMGKHFPLYAPNLWYILHDLHVWQDAVAWMDGVLKAPQFPDKSQHEALVRAHRDLLDLALYSEIQNHLFSTACQTIYMATYCSTRYLSDEHIDQMLAVVLDDVRRIRPADTTLTILPMVYTQKIMTTFRNGKRYQKRHSETFLHDLGDRLADGTLSTVGCVVHIDGNHWVAVVIDMRAKTLFYGDSLDASSGARGYKQTLGGREVPQALCWWLGQHGISKMDIDRLPTTIQVDGYSCGLMACNAVAHHFLPKQHPKIQPLEARVEKVLMMGRVLQLLTGNRKAADTDLVTPNSDASLLFSAGSNLPKRPVTPPAAVPPSNDDLDHLEAAFESNLSVSPVKLQVPARKRSASSISTLNLKVVEPERKRVKEARKPANIFTKVSICARSLNMK